MESKQDQNMETAILEAAERMFLEKGFDSTSTVQIAKAVGCNQALVHYYFRTKDNLFNTIFESKFKQFFQKIFDLSHFGEFSFTDKLIQFSYSHFDFLKENPKLPFLILNELSRKPENVKTLRNRLYSIPEQLIKQLNDELEAEIKVGNVRNILLTDIILTIVSLNVALFTMLPIAADIIGLNDATQNLMVQHRREENIKLILNYLKP